MKRHPPAMPRHETASADLARGIAPPVTDDDHRRVLAVLAYLRATDEDAA